MKGQKKNQGGFTLIELIIVIIILGILAALAIPQFAPATRDAQESSLKSNVSVMRTAINLYYHQHNGTYPGANNVSGTPASSNAEREAAFIAQLTQYTNENGQTSTTKSAAFPFGPYLTNRDIPENPIPNSNTTSANTNAVRVRNNNNELTADDSLNRGWQYSSATGEFIANNSAYEDL